MPRRIVIFALLAASCGGTGATRAKDPSSAGNNTPREVAIVHEPCDLQSAGAEVLDANQDKRPEVVTVIADGKPVCRAIDINLDGTIDVFSYFDGAGQTRRRESIFDRDDKPDEIAYYEGGRLVRKERETNHDGKIDTWDYFENDRLVREERDSAGDGFVNQWWTFSDPARPDCAVVVSDVDADGKPDESSRVDLCATEADGVRKTENAGVAAPGKPATTPASTFQGAPNPIPAAPQAPGSNGTP